MLRNNKSLPVKLAFFIRSTGFGTRTDFCWVQNYLWSWLMSKCRWALFRVSDWLNNTCLCWWWSLDWLLMMALSKGFHGFVNSGCNQVWSVGFLWKQNIILNKKILYEALNYMLHYLSEANTIGKKKKIYY